MPLHDIIFYDADCGFCRRWVGYVMKRDSQALFMFAPRPGHTFEKLISEQVRVHLPPSVVVLTREGKVLTRSSAVLHIQHRLGGFHRRLAQVFTWIPVWFRDAGYAMVAAFRHQLARPGVCAKQSPQQQARFLD